MARRRRLGLTSVSRYKVKAYRVHKIDGVPPELAMEVASAQTTNWMFRFGIFNQIWESKVVHVLQERGVRKELWGLYRAFTNQLVSKVLATGKQPPTDVILRWRGVLDEDVMNAIVQVIMSALAGREEAPPVEHEAGGG